MKARGVIDKRDIMEAQEKRHKDTAAKLEKTEAELRQKVQDTIAKLEKTKATVEKNAQEGLIKTWKEWTQDTAAKLEKIEKEINEVHVIGGNSHPKTMTQIIKAMQVDIGDIQGKWADLDTTDVEKACEEAKRMVADLTDELHAQLSSMRKDPKEQKDAESPALNWDMMKELTEWSDRIKKQAFEYTDNKCKEIREIRMAQIESHNIITALADKVDEKMQNEADHKLAKEIQKRVEGGR